ncbi:MAG: SMP-30/gluconolactonase/LRE family protein [Planctomycetes bacterium]|nr:SMP-30/gluconolactonase/LRE family protein [Planctomycetota bacterium]
MRSTEASVLFELDEYDGYLPEGPREADILGTRRIVWVNIQDGVNSKFGGIFNGSEKGHGSIKTDGRPGFHMPIAGGNRLLVGIEKDLKVFTFGKATFSKALATIPDNNSRTIINDGEVVPGGKAIVFGTKDTQFKEQIANLYLYTVDDNRVSLLADKQLCSNGKVIRTDERGLILFDIDTPKRNVVRYRLDIAARTATPDGVALDLADQAGFPDGMCDCGDGTVIIAFYNPDFAEAGKAIRFSLSTGKAVEEWTTPGSPRVTCPLLVKRPDGVKLILTTATEGMPAELRAKCPNAGCLFIADTQLESCPEPELLRMP